jgi:hypothetical protein
MYFCLWSGFALAAAALARRERYWILPGFALLLVFAWFGYYLWVLSLLCQPGGTTAGG